jgi:hypothetical protein
MSSWLQRSADLVKLGVPVEGATGRVSQPPVPGSRLVVVETKKEIQEFLTSRRAAITPEQAGVPSYGARRVPGLRAKRSLSWRASGFRTTHASNAET